MATRTSCRRISFIDKKCELCLDERDTIKLSNPSKWKNQDAMAYMLSLHPCVLNVCHACRQDITKVLVNDTFVPQWQKLSGRENKVCSVKACDSKVFASLHNADIIGVFNQCDLEPNATVTTPTPLCKHHYQVLYNKIHPMQTHCITCGSSLRHTKSKTCNQPNVIELYLKEKAGFEGTIKEGDKVCYVCYRSHLVILDTMVRVRVRAYW